MDFAERMLKLKERREALTQGREDASSALNRVLGLLDPGSFIQTDAYRTGGHAVTGYGLINARPVYVAAQDAGNEGGAMTREQSEKLLKLIDLAESTGAPLVLMPDSLGTRVEEGAQVLAAFADVFARLSKLSGYCPVITLLAGQAAGIAAQFVALSDFVVTVEGKGYAAPFAASVVNAVNATDAKEAELAGAPALYASGVAALKAADEDEALVLIRELVDLLPSSSYETSPFEDSDGLNRLLAMPPKEGAELVNELCDEGRLMELYAGLETEASVYLGRVGGYACGIVLAKGRFDAAGCDKISGFVRFCDAYDLPVITLVDSEGLAVPENSRLAELMKASGSLLSVYAQATTPKLAVICGNAVGAAYVSLAGKALSDITYAWPSAYVAPLTVDAAVQTFMLDELRETDRGTLAAKAEEQADAFAAAQAGLVDDVIDPAETRKHLIAALELLQTKSTVL